MSGKAPGVKQLKERYRRAGTALFKESVFRSVSAGKTCFLVAGLLKVDRRSGHAGEEGVVRERSQPRREPGPRGCPPVAVPRDQYHALPFEDGALRKWLVKRV